MSASTGAVSYSIRTPSWLTASSTFGVTDTNGVTITRTINLYSLELSPSEREGAAQAADEQAREEHGEAYELAAPTSTT